ncbi:MAG: hypothetical protein WDM85_01270 [Caulobacteraceae bacterium]
MLRRRWGVDETTALDVLLEGYKQRRFDRRTLVVGVSQAQTSWTCRPTAETARQATPGAEGAKSRGLLAFLDRRRPEAAPAPAGRLDPGDLRDELLDASREADAAAVALRVALERRRAAIVQLSARFATGSTGKAMIGRAFMPYACWRALVGLGLGELLGLPQVSVPHRQSFFEQASQIPAAPAAKQQETSHADVG